MSIIERQKQVTKIPVSHLNDVLPAPKSIKIEISPRCNYACTFCCINEREHKATTNDDMDWDFFVDVIRQCVELKIEEVGLFYIGESFMNPKMLVKAIKHCKDSGIPYVFLTSNGAIANKDIVEECMKAGLDSLKWSCNSANPEQFASVMQVPESVFYKQYKNIRDAWEVRNKGGYKTKLAASSIKYTDKQFELMSEFAKTDILPFVDEHYWLPLYTGAGQTIEESEQMGWKPTPGNTGTINDPSDPLPCWTVFTEGHVRANGKLSACCLDAVGTWDMGDLKKQSFMEAWNSPEFVKLRQAHLKKDVKGTICEKCALYK